MFWINCAIVVYNVCVLEKAKSWANSGYSGCKIQWVVSRVSVRSSGQKACHDGLMMRCLRHSAGSRFRGDARWVPAMTYLWHTGRPGLGGSEGETQGAAGTRWATDDDRLRCFRACKGWMGPELVIAILGYRSRSRGLPNCGLLWCREKVTMYVYSDIKIDKIGYPTPKQICSVSPLQKHATKSLISLAVSPEPPWAAHSRASSLRQSLQGLSSLLR